MAALSVGISVGSGSPVSSVPLPSLVPALHAMVLRVAWRRVGVSLPWDILSKDMTCRNLQCFTLVCSGSVLPLSPVVCL